MIKGVIFDFDGTLFDSMEIWNHIASDYLLTKGIKDYTVTERVAHMSMDKALGYIKEHYHIKDNIQTIQQDIQALLYHYYAYQTRPKSGVIDFIRKLYAKEIKMFILSASMRCLIEVALKHYDMNKYFEGIFCCDEMQLDKNNADIFLSVIQAINLSEKEVVVVEDAYHAIESAKSIGLNVIGIYDKSEKKDIKPLVDLYIYDYQEMEEYINEKGINYCWE